MTLIRLHPFWTWRGELLGFASTSDIAAHWAVTHGEWTGIQFGGRV